MNRYISRCIAPILALLVVVSVGLGADNATPTKAVHIKFAKGDTKISKLKEDVVTFTDKKYTLHQLPDDLAGLEFTARKANQPSDATIKIPANAPVYLFISGETISDKLRASYEQQGWQKIGEASITQDPSSDVTSIFIFQYNSDADQSLSIHTGGINDGFIAVKTLAIDPIGPTTQPGASNNPPVVATKPPSQLSSSAGAANAVRVTKYQTTIKMLYVIEQKDGSMLGGASDLILTADPHDPKGAIPVTFATAVGPQMNMVLDDVIRRFRVMYPNISGVNKFEFSFEDKYGAHDGGSIGAACGTLLLSLVRGFDVDSNVAMTGDVSAEGKVRAIGGVAAKLRGAKTAGCTIVAIPTENLDQLLDALIYGGTTTLTDVQVIGISTLDDGAAVARADRETKLAQAIALFGEVQASIKITPGYLNTPAALQKLEQVVNLEPNHLSVTEKH